MAPRRRIDQALAPRPPAIGADHVGLGARFIQEHEAVRVHVALPHVRGHPAGRSALRLRDGAGCRVRKSCCTLCYVT